MLALARSCFFTTLLRGRPESQWLKGNPPIGQKVTEEVRKYCVKGEID